MNNWIFILQGKELKQVRVVTSLKTKEVAATCGRGRYLVIFVVVEWLCLYLVPKSVRVAHLSIVYILWTLLLFTREHHGPACHALLS